MMEKKKGGQTPLSRQMSGGAGCVLAAPEGGVALFLSPRTHLLCACTAAQRVSSIHCDAGPVRLHRVTEAATGVLVTGTGSCSSGCVVQICTAHKSYKAHLSPPLLLLRFAARASQERLSAERAPKHGSEPLTWSQQPADITQRARAEEGAVARNLPRPQALFPLPLTPLPGWLASPLG
ncbi:unnamed protein product [Pleuronectes platessa]|uniref:Uncharacterized protein n=1 Tax=Pleuronectes platessa TaxID=8262 RepID=A0A9N7VWT5_PLEPL|nr:unnamed protein product [Pleuronectes platessa]